MRSFLMVGNRSSIVEWEVLKGTGKTETIPLGECGIGSDITGFSPTKDKSKLYVSVIRNIGLLDLNDDYEPLSIAKGGGIPRVAFRSLAIIPNTQESMIISDASYVGNLYIWNFGGGSAVCEGIISYSDYLQSNQNSDILFTSNEVSAFPCQRDIKLFDVSRKTISKNMSLHHWFVESLSFDPNRSILFSCCKNNIALSDMRRKRAKTENYRTTDHKNLKKIYFNGEHDPNSVYVGNYDDEGEILIFDCRKISSGARNVVKSKVRCLTSLELLNRNLLAVGGKDLKIVDLSKNEVVDEFRQEGGGNLDIGGLLSFSGDAASVGVGDCGGKNRK